MLKLKKRKEEKFNCIENLEKLPSRQRYRLLRIRTLTFKNSLVIRFKLVDSALYIYTHLCHQKFDVYDQQKSCIWHPVKQKRHIFCISTLPETLKLVSDYQSVHDNSFLSNGVHHDLLFNGIVVMKESNQNFPNYTSATVVMRSHRCSPSK